MDYWLLFSVLQKHYKVVEAMALNYEDVPEISDQTGKSYWKRVFWSIVFQPLINYFSLLFLYRGFTFFIKQNELFLMALLTSETLLKHKELGLCSFNFFSISWILTSFFETIISLCNY